MADASQKLNKIHAYLLQAKVNWSLSPIIDSLSALRGIDTLAAMIIISELGDLTRFTHPSQLMAYLGLVPGEHTSSTRRRLDAITKAGKDTRITIVAIARELAGFVWDIAEHETNKLNNQNAK